MNKRSSYVHRPGVLAAGLALAILSLDLILPYTVGLTSLYVVVVIVALWSRQDRFALAAALGTTVLVAADLVLAADVRGRGWGALNHPLAVAAVWATALVVYRYKLTERARAREQAEAQAYLDVAAVVLLVLDYEGRVRMINRRGCEILGCEPAEVTGRAWIDSFVPERERERTRSEFGRLVREELEPDPERSFPNHLLTSSGEERLIAWRNTVLRDSVGRVRGTVSSGEDITERTILERTLRAQESLAKMGQLAAVVAHEVRNPLAGIRGAIQVLGGRLPESGDRKIVHNVIDRLDALNLMTEDLLVYARPRPLEPVPIRLSVVLSEARRLLAGHADLAAVDVEIAGADAQIEADPSLLQAAFLNLFLNAGQAMRGEGTIRVAVRKDARTVQVDVEDQGPGIPAENRERLFEPFFTTRHRGTGLGLPIVERDVEAHGGEVSITCPEDGGTRIRVILPLKR